MLLESLAGSLTAAVYVITCNSVHAVFRGTHQVTYMQGSSGIMEWLL
jgi:hypothetical protein